ncbi:hypothetical protein [Acidisoma sp. 7E03]
MANCVTVSNIQALRNYTGGSSTPVIWVEGYSSPGDGGEGMFTFVASDTTSGDNTGTIILDAAGNRYYREQHRGPYNILWFGGSPNGVSDNLPALYNAIYSLPQGGGEVFFPPGTFLFSGAMTYDFPAGNCSVSLTGAGADASILYWPSTAGMVLNASSPQHSVHLRDISITTGTTNVQGVALTNSSLLGQFAQSDVTRVTFRGGSWNPCLLVRGLSNVAYDTVLFYGNSASTGLTIEGNSGTAPYYTIVHNISKCGFFGLGTGFQYGTYLQGVTIDQCNFTNGVTGVLLPYGAVGATQLAISNSQFNTTGNQVLLDAPIGSVFMSGNLIYIPANNTGVLISTSSAVDQSTFIGNSFSSPVTSGNNTGLFNLGASVGTTVVGNTFVNLTVGVNLSGASNWNVQANSYSNVQNHVLNVGSNSVGVATP